MRLMKMALLKGIVFNCNLHFRTPCSKGNGNLFRTWSEEDYCGFLFDTPDGRIWLPGDSRLLESHLHMPVPDLILFDFSDNDWHIGLEGAVRLANAYPAARLVLIHWGTVDAPDMTPFNANPHELFERIMNPDRICLLWPGEKTVL